MERVCTADLQLLRIILVKVLKDLRVSVAEVLLFLKKMVSWRCGNGSSDLGASTMGTAARVGAETATRRARGRVGGGYPGEGEEGDEEE